MLVHKDLHKLIELGVRAAGYELYGYECSAGSSVLRVYIESAQGVTVADCARTSRQLGVLLNAEEPVQNQYSLEVSSPGIERRCFNLGHYQRYLGVKVAVKLSVPMPDKRHCFIGVIESVDKEQVNLILEDQQKVCLPMHQISKTTLVVATTIKKMPRKLSLKGEKTHGE